jgi:4-hydroxy-2-oxoheptanedioate aldolase
MRRPNALKDKLEAGGQSRGCFLLTDSADNAEVLAHCGWDFLLIDHEHGSGSVTDAIAQMRALAGTSTVSMVRVSAFAPGHLRRILDAGAQCILAPMIEDAVSAENIVAACRFPPRGNRGAGGGTRSGLYGLDAEYTKRVDAELLIALQIESVKGIDNIAEIAAVSGVDLLIIGPRDLSASIGKLGEFDDLEVLGLMHRAEQAILASGKRLGSVIYPGRTAKEMFDRGYSLLIMGSDVSFLLEGARQALGRE